MTINFNDETAKQAIFSGKPVVIDFWAEWCGPCRHMSPIVDELADEYDGRIVVGKYDVDNNSDFLADYNIRNIPTILFFKDGELKDRNVGSTTKDKLKAKFDSLL